MRSQNPPKEFLDKAQEIEQYLGANLIGSVYGIASLFYCVTVWVLFAFLVDESFLKPTFPAVATFSLVAFVPPILALLAYLIRPKDPLSSYVLRHANVWRRPLPVSPEQCIFNEMLLNGDNICIQLSFYYPPADQTDDVKERLYSYVNAALAKHCSMTKDLPTNEQINDVVDPALEVLAVEHNILVLYSEIRDVRKLPNSFNSDWETQTSVDYWGGTGTCG